MILENLKLINFRNYEELLLDIHPKLNVFVGDNAQGKTNVMEAIYICSLGHSFRTKKEEEMINIKKKQAYVKVTVNKGIGRNDIEIKLSKEERKKIKINGLRIEKYGDLFGVLNTVIFTPDDLKIVKGGPIERRKFIDNEICQVLPKYYYYLMQYNRILLQKNKLLREGKGNQIDIDIWNQQLSDIGAYIIYNRIKFIKRLSILSKLLHRKITEEEENLDVIYKCSFQINEKSDIDEIKESFYKAIRDLKREEFIRKTSLLGPHRDDIVFKINNYEVKNYGSQGQKRTTVLSLKLAELELIKGEVGEYPILLLDDVMSELDLKRQYYLLNNLKDIQTFITTTQIDQYNLDKIANKKIYNVIRGKVMV